MTWNEYVLKLGAKNSDEVELILWTFTAFPFSKDIKFLLIKYEEQ